MTEVTGARVDVGTLVDKTPDEMWDLVTDVARIGEWSPECAGATWQDGGTPRPGARFAGHNEFAGGFKSTVTCVVTEAARPAVFEWVVLDPSGALERPGSIWRYELVPGLSDGQTTVRHSFVHGPGDTGLKRGMHENPAESEAILTDRLETLRTHMTVTLEGMANS